PGGGTRGSGGPDRGEGGGLAGEPAFDAVGAGGGVGAVDLAAADVDEDRGRAGEDLVHVAGHQVQGGEDRVGLGRDLVQVQADGLLTPVGVGQAELRVDIHRQAADHGEHLAGTDELARA